MNHFVLTNDPDHGVLRHYRKVFYELGQREIFVTTAVFCTLKDDGSDLSRHCFENETHCLADDAYRDFMLELRDRGHEIAFHGYSQVSDTRDEFQKGIELFYRAFKEYPKVYIEHGGHPGTHPPGICKKENLKLEGASPDSRHFVKDLVREVFELVWTHDYLLDGCDHPLSAKDIFQWEDGIRYFKRWRLVDVEKLMTNLSQKRDTIVGYTHFGYRGYEPRPWFKKPFRKESWFRNRKDHRRLEWWSERSLRETADLLAQLLYDHQLESLTLSGLLRATTGGSAT